MDDRLFEFERKGLARSPERPEAFDQMLADLAYFSSEGMQPLSDPDFRRLYNYLMRAALRADAEHERRYGPEV